MAARNDAWTTLPSVRQFLGLSQGHDDEALLVHMIESASAAGRAFLGYDPAPADYAEYYDGDGSDCIICRHWPIIGVNALSDLDTSVGTQDTDYMVYPEEGVVRLYSGRFSATPRGVYCHYSAGLSPWPPDDLQQAANEMVQAKYAGRGTGTDNDRQVKSERVGDYQVTYEDGTTQATRTAADIPAKARAVLDRYRNILPGGTR